MSDVLFMHNSASHTHTHKMKTCILYCAFKFFFPDKKTKGYKVGHPVLLLQANSIKDYNMQNKTKQKKILTRNKKMSQRVPSITHKSEKSEKGGQRRKEGEDKKIQKKK